MTNSLSFVRVQVARLMKGRLALEDVQEVVQFLMNDDHIWQPDDKVDHYKST